MKQLNTVLTLTSNIAVLIGIILVIIELRQNDDTLNFGPRQGPPVTKRPPAPFDGPRQQDNERRNGSRQVP